MNTSLLRLFNAVKIENKVQHTVSKEVLERTIRNGYILQPEIKPTSELLDIIEGVIGISGEKANNSFHKSWKIIQDTPQEVLWMQAILHYITTYGFEEIGAYREDTVYIPNEVLELPEITNDIPLTVVKGMTNKEILETIVNLGSSGIALSQETLNDIMTIVLNSQFDNGFVEKIENRELKALLRDYYGLVPSEPVEFLRHLISKLTDESLIIKNDYLIEKIKQSNGKFLDELLKAAPEDLASIFFRYKPLFLAMKSISRNKTFFNRLRKQANKLHKPLPEDYLNNVTARIKQDTLSIKTLQQKLEKASIFRKIRLLYALNYRLNIPDTIVYRIRNGRGWATEFEWLENSYMTEKAYLSVFNSIVDSIQENVEGKNIYIPSNVSYALPATEKQFTGNLPTGSYVTVPNDLIVGIHWFNTTMRVDLDLSVISESGKVGWDSYYTDYNSNVLFSGDMTDARNGASELFYIKNSEQEAKILMVNFYNFSNGETVDCKILAAQEKPKNFDRNYMVDINNIVLSVNINVSKSQTVLGLITNVEGENRVYFANMSIGNSITSSRGAQSEQARKYLVSSVTNSISLKEVLSAAGAKVVTDKKTDIDIDLSPELLDKSTIVNLLLNV